MHLRIPTIKPDWISRPTIRKYATSNGKQPETRKVPDILGVDARIYTPKNDPMLKLTPEELAEVKKEVAYEGKRVASTAYAITGGALGLFAGIQV
jgi:hypothetical protein